jgi:Cd2+/Zn2+-exporting ATPase
MGIISMADVVLMSAFLLTVVLIKTANLSFGMLIHDASVLPVTINAARLPRHGKA